MIDLHRILYATISSWELSESLRRDDPTFDAWEYLSKKIGHKNPSTLRKMCQRKWDNNNAKLGLEEAITIMTTTCDYRLLRYAVKKLKDAATSDDRQMDLFSRSVNSIEQATKE